MTADALKLVDRYLTELVARTIMKTAHRAGFFEYMNHRRQDEDMHAVSDAANDVRELDAELRCLDEMQAMLGQIAAELTSQ